MEMKTEFNMGNLTLERFHKMFIEADYFAIRSRNFSLNSMTKWYAVLKQIYINIYFYALEDRRKEIDDCLDQCEKTILKIISQKQKNDDLVSFNEIVNLLKNLEKAHLLILSVCNVVGLILPYSKKLTTSEKIQRSIKGGFVDE